MLVVIGSVQPVQPVRPFRQILIIGVAPPLRCAGGGALSLLSVFLFNWIFGWTPWTGWTALAKSGTSSVQPKISRLDTLDRPPTHQCRWRPLVTNLYDSRPADHALSRSAASKDFLIRMLCPNKPRQISRRWTAYLADFRRTDGHRVASLRPSAGRVVLGG
jgi:hypothetical protein